MEKYESPQMEIIEVLVEHGFTSSINGGLGDSEGMDGDGDINVGW